MIVKPAPEGGSNDTESHPIPGNRHGCQRSLSVSALFIAMTVCACGGIPAISDDEAKRRDPDRLLVTDCLLPGLLIGLGTEITYLGPPRPIKASVHDCARQGGEYVLYDRANQQTALKVWSDKAAAGDPEAQTYVGEIYEKGLGVAPDHELAALWYRRAADQGYARAQLNLGYLYELGLGVEQDIGKAIEFYRKASGLTDGTIEYVSSLELTRRKSSEIQAQRSAEQIAQLQLTLDQTRSRYQQLRQINEANKETLDALSQEVAQQRRVVIASTEVEADNTTGELLKRIDSLKKGLSDAKAEQVRLHEALFSQQIQTLDAKKALRMAKLALEDGHAALNLSDQTANDLQQKLESAEIKETEMRAALERHQEILKQKEAALEQQREDYAGQLIELQSTADDQLSEAEARLLELENELAQREETIAEQSAQLSELEDQLGRKHASINTIKADQSSPAGTDSFKFKFDELLIVETRQSAILKVPQESGSPIRGSLTPAQEAASITVNEQAQSLDDAGFFTYVHQGEERLDFIAQYEAAEIARLAVKVVPTTGTDDNAQPPGLPFTSFADIDFGNFHALIIGNRHYDSLSNLDSVEQDARHLERLLRARYGFRTTLLIDAGYSDMLEALNELRERVKERDQIIIYFAGHSQMDEEGQNCFWLPVDYQYDKPEIRLSNIKLSDIVDTMAAQQVLLIADACHTNTLSSAAIPRPEVHRAPTYHVDWIRHMADTRVRTVLTSGAIRPLSDPNNSLGLSVFTEALIDQLYAVNADVIETYAIFEKIRDQVVQTSGRLGSEQRPDYLPIRHAGHQPGDFLFVSALLN